MLLLLGCCCMFAISILRYINALKKKTLCINVLTYGLLTFNSTRGRFCAPYIRTRRRHRLGRNQPFVRLLGLCRISLARTVAEAAFLRAGAGSERRGEGGGFLRADAAVRLQRDRDVLPARAVLHLPQPTDPPGPPPQDRRRLRANAGAAGGEKTEREFSSRCFLFLTGNCTRS